MSLHPAENERKAYQLWYVLHNRATGQKIVRHCTVPLPPGFRVVREIIARTEAEAREEAGMEDEQ